MSDEGGGSGTSGAVPPAPDVGAIATLYLGNVLYALERCALSLEAEEKPADAAFYRGIARKLAEAHGAAKLGRRDGDGAG